MFRFSFCQRSSQPNQILAGLAQAEGIDWSLTKIYFADERCVPLDHSDRYVVHPSTAAHKCRIVRSELARRASRLSGSDRATAVLLHHLEQLDMWTRAS